MKNYIILLILFISCGARKTETVKEIDKLESIENTNLKSFDFNRNYFMTNDTEYINETFDKGVISTRNTYKSSKSSKLETKIKYATKTTYKTITTFKSVKNKSTEKKEPYITFGIGFVVLAVLIYALIKK